MEGPNAGYVGSPRKRLRGCSEASPDVDTPLEATPTKAEERYLMSVASGDCEGGMRLRYAGSERLSASA